MGNNNHGSFDEGGARPTAVVLLAHGSMRTSATEYAMHEIRRRLQGRFPATPVKLAFFEFLEPNLEVAVKVLRAEGIERAVVLPYFLFAGKEIKLEIPEELERVGKLVPEVELHLARELGVDDRLIEHVAGRVAGALRGLSQFKPVAGRMPSTRDRGRVGVVLCNRGSRKQYDAGERLEELCARLRTRLGPDALVEPAQAERDDERTVERASDRLIAAGAERVVVVPYLHFFGKVLAKNIAPGVRNAQAQHPAAKFYLAQTLCVNDPAMDICVDRLLETGLVATVEPVVA